MPVTYMSELPLRHRVTTMVVPMFFSSRSRAAIAMISSLACTMDRRRMFLVSSLPIAADDVLLQLARHDFDGALAGDLAGRLTAHAVGHQADRHVGERLDIDGVFVVLAVVAQQRSICRYSATGPWGHLVFPRSVVAEAAGAPRRENHLPLKVTENPHASKYGEHFLPAGMRNSMHSSILTCFPPIVSVRSTSQRSFHYNRSECLGQSA